VNKSYKEVFFMFVSCHDNSYNWDKIRESKLKNYKIFVGKNNNNIETNYNNDVVKLDCSDSYISLCEKIFHMLKWVKKNINSDDILYFKIDDTSIYTKKSLKLLENKILSTQHNSDEFYALKKNRFPRVSHHLMLRKSLKDERKLIHIARLKGHYPDGGHGYYLNLKAITAFTEDVSLNGELKPEYKVEKIEDIFIGKILQKNNYKIKSKFRNFYIFNKITHWEMFYFNSNNFYVIGLINFIIGLCISIIPTFIKTLLKKKFYPK